MALRSMYNNILIDDPDAELKEFFDLIEREASTDSVEERERLAEQIKNLLKKSETV
jgi:hypothetical protein